MQHVVVVTGSRSWPLESETFLQQQLDEIHREHKSVVLIEGGCYKGVDRMAKDYALQLGWTVITVKADWHAHGRVAGPLRNSKMLEDHDPHEVIAFCHGESKGTMDTFTKSLKRLQAKTGRLIKVTLHAIQQGESEPTTKVFV